MYISEGLSLEKKLEVVAVLSSGTSLEINDFSEALDFGFSKIIKVNF